MFKTTNDFFDTVLTGNVTDIDIQEFVYKKTKKHNLEKLKTFLRDIEFYLFAEKDFLNADITPEMWEEKHNYYKEKGEKTPFVQINNFQKTLKEIKGENTAGLAEFHYYYDEEALFYPVRFFCIYELEKYVTRLIQKIENIDGNIRHENIFSNNGFALFEHILNEYVKPKPNRGRLSDIHFFYWSMYENNPQLIHQRPQRFKEWFFDNYDNEDLGKIKTLQQVVNTDRLKHYSNALEWFKTRT